MEKLKNTFVCNMEMWVGYSNCVKFKADHKYIIAFLIVKMVVDVAKIRTPYKPEIWVCL